MFNDQVIDGYVEVRPDVIQAIARVTRNGGSLDARANGARALGILRADPALPDLAAALSTKDSTVLYGSLEGLRRRFAIPRRRRVRLSAQGHE